MRMLWQGRISDKKGGEVFLSDLSEVSGVRAVVASDDKEEVHGLFVFAVEHSKEGILSFLGGTADGVEYVVGALVAIAIDDCQSESVLKCFSFALEHGGLVGHTDFL